MTITRVDAEVLHDLRWRVLHPERAPNAGRMAGDLSPKARHWALWQDGVVVGGVSVLAVRGWALRSMVIDPAWQRQGLGMRLLQHVVAEVGGPMWCNARVAAVPFYEAAGWRAVGPRFEMDGEGEHQRMVWG